MSIPCKTQLTNVKKSLPISGMHSKTGGPTKLEKGYHDRPISMKPISMKKPLGVLKQGKTESFITYTCTLELKLDQAMMFEWQRHR